MLNPADVWLAADADGEQQLGGSFMWSQHSSTANIPPLPAVRRSTVSAPSTAQQQSLLPCVGRPSSSGSSSISRMRAASAGGGGSGTGSRLSALGSLAPLRPATASNSSDGVASGEQPGLPPLHTLSAAGHCASSAASGNSTSASSCSSPAPSELQAAVAVAAEKAKLGLIQLPPVGEASTASSESSSSSCHMMIMRQRSSLSCSDSGSSGGNAPGGSSRGSSRGSSTGGQLSGWGGGGSSSSGQKLQVEKVEAVVCVQDSMAAAEAELDAMMQEAEAAAERDVVGAVACSSRASRNSSGTRVVHQPPLSQHGPCEAGAEAAAGQQQQLWHDSVLQSLAHIQRLSLSPCDAPALLQHCADLQCLLATAADWGVLQTWLVSTPSRAAAAAAAASDSVATSHSSLQPSGSSAADLRSVLVQSLVRLVDSKKPDVLVKVRRCCQVETLRVCVLHHQPPLMLTPPCHCHCRC